MAVRKGNSLELVEPLVVPNPLWRPGRSVDTDLTVGQKLIYGGIARKP